MLRLVAARIEELESETEKLKARLAESPGGDPEAEFETLGQEITAILQSAREAAQSMRERASLDASRWRSEAMEEAETTRRDAVADAEALRRDAWVTGTELLEQSQEAGEGMRAAAERDVLTVMGEAEREAHRLTSGARRDAEDLMRNASMDAEKMVAEATARRDAIIDGANRQAASAQERTRALEARRDELLEELENVRSTLARVEGSLEERREALDLTRTDEPSSVRIVHPPDEAEKDWELGETVRVIPQEGRGKPDPDAVMAEEMSDEVARIQEPDPRVPRQTEPRYQSEPEPRVEDWPKPVRDEPEPEVVPEPEPEVVPEPERDEAKAVSETEESEPEPGPEVEEPEEEEHDEVEALFASLRGGDDTDDRPTEETADPEDTTQPADDDTNGEGTDWIEVRDARLLPITNRALRGVRKAMTEVQNVALDSLRTEGEWKPDESWIAESVHAELLAVWSESFAVGHSVAEDMTGSMLERPDTPASSADRDFASDLASAVTTAIDNAGNGTRERQSAASRVFRVWRSDEAERRIRDIALAAYENGIERSKTVTTS